MHIIIQSKSFCSDLCSNPHQEAGMRLADCQRAPALLPTWMWAHSEDPCVELQNEDLVLSLWHPSCAGAKGKQHQETGRIRIAAWRNVAMFCSWELCAGLRCAGLRGERWLCLSTTSPFVSCITVMEVTGISLQFFPASHLPVTTRMEHLMHKEGAGNQPCVGQILTSPQSHLSSALADHKHYDGFFLLLLKVSCSFPLPDHN